MWLHSLKVAQLLRSADCLHTNQSRSYLNHLVRFKIVVIDEVDIRFHIFVKLILSQNCSFRNETKHTYEPLYIDLCTCETPVEDAKERMLKTELTDEYFIEQRNLNTVNVHKFSFVEIVNGVH